MRQKKYVWSYAFLALAALNHRIPKACVSWLYLSSGDSSLAAFNKCNFNIPVHSTVNTLIFNTGYTKYIQK